MAPSNVKECKLADPLVTVCDTAKVVVGCPFGLTALRKSVTCRSVEYNDCDKETLVTPLEQHQNYTKDGKTHGHDRLNRVTEL
jgi:hypothetical protein